MEFFNRKEEVIDIQLTPYGKNRLSLGKFKPSYYAFYDSDVIYNVGYGSATYSENQKDSEDRIKEIPRLKTQPLRYGAESKISEYLDIGKVKEIDGLIMSYTDFALEKLRVPFEPTENTSTLRTPLGNSNLNSYYLPYWELYSLIGDVASATHYYTGSSDYQNSGQIIERIPQINVDLVYKTFISGEDDENVGPFDGGLHGLESVENPYENTSFYSPEIYEDGSKIYIQKQFSLIDLIEGHVDDKIHNFDIEVYEIESQIEVGTKGTIASGKDLLKKLKFRKNDYLELGEYEIYNENLLSSTQIDDTYVEYYFEVKVDEEIEDIVRGALPSYQDPATSLPLNDYEEPCDD